MLTAALMSRQTVEAGELALMEAGLEEGFLPERSSTPGKDQATRTTLPVRGQEADLDLQESCMKTTYGSSFWSNTSEIGLIKSNEVSMQDKDDNGSTIKTSYSSSFFDKDVAAVLEQRIYADISDSIGTRTLLTDYGTSFADVDASNEIKTHVKRQQRYHRERRDVEIIQLYEEVCCEKKCVWNLSPNCIMGKERWLHAMNEVKLKQFLLDDMHQHAHMKDNRLKCIYMISGHEMCEDGYLKVYDVKKRRLNDVKLLFSKGVRQIIHGNEGTSRTREGTTIAYGWMALNLGRMGDYMPHDNKVYLPVCESKRNLYQRMCKEVFPNAGKKEKVTEKYFKQMWTQHFKEYIVGKPSTFAICSDCIGFQEQVKKAPDELARKEAQALLNRHKKQAEVERHHYHTRRLQAQQNPEEWLTIIIDGMDQNKTDVPHFATESKSTSGLLRLRTHVTGVMVHTDCRDGKEAYAYIDVTEYPHDANLTMSIILDILEKYMHKPSRKLHLQLDNCFRENKNKYVLSLAWMLVHLEIFDEVHFAFLPVGHTHEIIDQMFSRIAVSIRKNNIYTLDGLKHIVTNSYTPAIQVEEIQHVIDCREWLLRGMEKEWGNHSKPHHFVFKRVNGETVMFYKNWVTDAWRPNEKGHDLALIEDEVEKMAERFTNGIRCMAEIPNLDDQPAVILPLPRKFTLDDLQKAVPKDYGARVPETHHKWWEDYFKSFRLRVQGKDAQIGNKEDWALKRLANRPQPVPKVVVETEEMARLRKRVMEDCPDVYCQPKKPSKRKKVNNTIASTKVNVQEDVSAPAEEETVSLPVKDYTFRGTVELGDIVVVYLDEYEGEFPQIAEVQEICEDNSLQILFYRQKNGVLRVGQKWTPSFRLKEHKCVPYTSKILVSDVKLVGLEKVNNVITVDENLLDVLLALETELELA